MNEFQTREPKARELIRRLLVFFIVCLFLSGLTALPIEWELSILLGIFHSPTLLHAWLLKVVTAYHEVGQDHPFLLYGYDWLALAHFILAILFVGPYRDPVKNIWVMEFGLIACVLVIPGTNCRYFFGNSFRMAISGLFFWSGRFYCAMGRVSSSGRIHTSKQ